MQVWVFTICVDCLRKQQHMTRGNNNYNTANEDRKFKNNLNSKYWNHSGVNINNDAVYYQCWKCVYKHRVNNCSAYEKYCRLCNKPNHFVVAWFKNKKNIILVHQNKYESEQDYLESLIDSCELVWELKENLKNWYFTVVTKFNY